MFTTSHEGGYPIVITSDRATMTNYSEFNALGFLLCLPERVLPSPIAKFFVAPRLKVSKDGRPSILPYALRKIEAALYMCGFTDEDFIITTPEVFHKFVGPNTKIVAIHVLDPMGMAPVSYTLRALFGGGRTWTCKMFLELVEKIRKLKERYKFTFIAGGPGTWQLRGIYKDLGIDLLIHGEGEIVFPEICKNILNGEKIEGEVEGDSVPLELIPPIRGPSRGGMVQITRGCPRRCRFCNPTMFNFRSIPLDVIDKELKVNKRAGYRLQSLVTEDGLLYGAKGVIVNRDALRKLIKVLKENDVRGDFCHVSIATTVQAPDIVEEWAKENGHLEDCAFPQVGLETGSPRLLKIYMAGKAAPFKIEQWPELAEEATEIMNRCHWYPCYTLILGLPEETEDDVKATIDLIKRLKGRKCWIFPLLFVPMGGSALEDKDFANVRALTEDIYVEVIYQMLDHNIDYTLSILDLFVSRIKNKFARNIMRKFIGNSVRSLIGIKEEVRKNFPKLLEIARSIDLNNPITLSRLIIGWIINKFKSSQ